MHFGNQVKLPVLVEGAASIFSVELELTFDTDKLAVVGVDPAGLADGFTCFHKDTGGTLRIAMAGRVGACGNGEIARVTFTKSHLPIPTLQSRVSLVDVLFNEGVPEAVIEGQSCGDVHRLGLGPVAPSPFADGTRIQFSLAEPGEVRVSIYNVSGQLVTELVNSALEAGHHSAMWDGRDSRGERVARGVYFCRMDTPVFSATEKIVLLK
jgi:hypothetical protein